MNANVPMSVCMAIAVIGTAVQISAQSNVSKLKASTVHCHKKHRTDLHRSKRPVSELKTEKAGEFNGDLRDIPPGKPVRRGTASVREPKIEPKPFPTPKSNEK